MQTDAAVARILIVDDDEDVVAYLRLVLSRVPEYRIESVLKPAEALELVQNAPFDVVLSDIGMPELRGTELAKRIQEVSPTTRIVLMSGDEPAHVARAAGVTEFLQKPIDRSTLLETIERVLNRSAATSKSGNPGVS